MTTDTTEAERPPRRSDDSVAPAKADPTPVAEEAPVVEAPVLEEPVVEVPAEVVVEEPEAGRSVAEESLTDEAVAAEPVAEEPVVEEPVADEPVAESAVAPSEVDDDARAVGDERGVAVIPVGSSKPAPRKKRTLRVARPAPDAASRVLAIDGLVKRYGDTTAVDAISLEVRAGSFYGIVGPNGAGKTTTLSMVTGLLRPDAGTVHINDIDVWKDPRAAKRATGVLPDRLRLFDRLTGSELLYYSGSLRGLDHATVLDRSADLATAFGLEDALDRLVADYSAGMTKKIALACAMIHSPRLLVLDEPFESVDPVSAANLTDILERYVAGGGTVLLSSHSMDLIERVCDSAAIIVGGRVLASGPLDEVRQGQTLEDRFVELAGGRKAAEGLEWLHSFSD
ncbi:ABC transporter ATP-binding protein [Agromyces indicus]|uniref:ATP-binding cassette domain-containing protein n=1 Tax=Agromyces indicus TaxID=758919 RepID=A0ABU1FJC1_9MICO|nr:ATP-binding cassette domain-containing protein [Agromyces indicus]MDR5691853.1 ATP-binding cassette domain-containing protein [Agromyces indicus]